MLHLRRCLVALWPALFAACLTACQAPPVPTPPASSAAPAEEFRGVSPYWQAAREGAYEKVPTLLAQHRAELAQGLHHRVLLRGNPQRKEIALTFDDGPHNISTPQLLAILAHFQVKATFFLVGEMSQRYPDLVAAERLAGHSLGNHTFHHVNLTKIPPAQVAAEIRACGDVVKAICGHRPHLFRPPGGAYNESVGELAELLGYTMVLWTDDPGDWQPLPPAELAQRTFSRLSSGGILLLHDGPQQTLDMLPLLIRTMQSRGYQFVTVDEMLEHAAG